MKVFIYSLTINDNDTIHHDECDFLFNPMFSLPPLCEEVSGQWSRSAKEQHKGAKTGLVCCSRTLYQDGCLPKSELEPGSMRRYL